MKHMTRKEIFMAALAKGENPPIKPLTREEHLMAAHAKREASGGGGTGGGASEALPLIIFTENQDTYEWSCNKTFDECLELVTNGTFIAMKRNGNRLRVMTDCHRFESFSGTELYFADYDFDRQRPCGVMWGKGNDGEVWEIHGDYEQSME